MLFTQYSALALAALASGVSANLKIRNNCKSQVTIVQSHAGGCNTGANGKCGSAPYYVNTGATQELRYNTDGQGTSVKIGKKGVSGILQFEYTVSGGLWWDLSDLDGRGAGLVGTPFAKDNVKVTPTGKGSGSGTCVPIRCKANKVCLDSYQHPDDTNTKFCPSGTGNVWLDLCMDSSKMNSKREIPQEYQVEDAEDFQVEDSEEIEADEPLDYEVEESEESEEPEAEEFETEEPQSEVLVARAFTA